MRQVLFVWMGLFGCQTGCSKPMTPDPAPTPAPPPLLTFNEGPLPDQLRQPAIPQVKDKILAGRADRLAFYRSTTVEAYPRAGRKNPKWDEAAIDALEKLAVAKANDDRDADAVEAAWDALSKAISLGCDDPMIRYAHFRYGPQFRFGKLAHAMSRQEYRKRMDEVCLPLRDSDYPAVRRAHAAYNYFVGFAEQPDEQVNAWEALGIARRFLREALTEDPKHVVDDFMQIAGLCMERAGPLHLDRRKAFEAFDSDLPDREQFLAARLWLKGKYLQGEAWGSRGHEFADRVPEENMRVFHEKLAESREAFEAAWEADLTHAEVAVGMMQAAGPVGDFQALEAWFQRAMTADGDCTNACLSKLNYLHPKWEGHSEAMRAFAVRLAETKNWDAGLPFLSIALYHDFGVRSSGEDGVLPRDWPAVEQVFEDFLKHRPDSKWGRTKYFKLAAESGQYKIAVRVGESLNGDCAKSVFDRAEFSGLLKYSQSRLRNQ
jgi:hypothetical protein